MPKITLNTEAKGTVASPPRVERAAATRERTSRKKVYRRPDGDSVRLKDQSYKLRWVRKSVQGRDDPDNIIARRQEGYEPVKPEELENNPYEGLDAIGKSGVIQRKDTILMKIPEEDVEAKADYLESRTDLLQEAVDSDYDNVSNPKYIRIERSGTKPVVLREKANPAQFEDQEGGDFGVVGK